MESLVKEVNQYTGGHLNITRDDVNNEIKRLNAAKKKENPLPALPPPFAAEELVASPEAATVPKAPSSPTQMNVDCVEMSSASSLSNTEAPQLPNRCSIPNCGAPTNLPPSHCTANGCSGFVHAFCASFLLGAAIASPELSCYDCIEAAKSPPVQNEAESASNQCLWTCMMPTHAPDKCSVCNGMVHRVCEAAGEAANGWTAHGETVLFCPTCHPDSSRETSIVSSAANTESSTANVAPPDDSASSADPTESFAASSKKSRNKGGRPKGTDSKNKRAQRRARRDATNFVVREMSMLQKEESKKKRHQKRIRLQNGTRESIVKRAIEKFQVKGKFDVPKQTIHNRIQKNRLEVQQSGVQSPVLFVEVVLVSFIINAWALNCPISVGGTVSLMNNLVEGTEHEAKLIKWKKDRGLLDSDPSAPLLGDGWLRGFQRRNPTLKAKYGRRYPRNRQEHCNDTTFTKMYDQTEVLITKSGNARPFETPVHMDIEGNVVENESLAFGRPVTLDIHRKTNCFLGDEVGDNTHGKDDGNNFAGCISQASSPDPRITCTFHLFRMSHNSH
jgi:hypothetical protein